MKPRLMVVDDNEMMCEFLRVYFAKDFKVQTFQDGYHALQQLNKTESPDIILLDLNMPELSGFDFLKMFNQVSPDNRPPIFVLSSQDSSQDRISCLNLGAVDYLIKPFHPKELALRIKQRMNIAS